MKIFMLLLILFGSAVVCAQEIEGVEGFYEKSTNKIRIRYQLIAKTPNETFHVNVFAVYPDSTVLLKQVSGEVGDYILSGANKMVEWDFEKEVAYFAGQVNFVVEAQHMLSINEKKDKFKRTKSYIIPVDRNFSKENFHLTLYHNKKLLDVPLDYEINEKSINVTIPDKIKTSSNYQFHLSSGDQNIFSQSVKVKYLIPRFLYVVPVIVAGGVFLYSDYNKNYSPLPEPSVELN